MLWVCTAAMYVIAAMYCVLYCIVLCFTVLYICAVHITVENCSVHFYISCTHYYSNVVFFVHIIVQYITARVYIVRTHCSTVCAIHFYFDWLITIHYCTIHLYNTVAPVTYSIVFFVCTKFLKLRQCLENFVNKTILGSWVITSTNMI